MEKQGKWVVIARLEEAARDGCQGAAAARKVAEDMQVPYRMIGAFM